jgi:hypothetical protein
MATLTSQQVKDLSKQFYTIFASIGQYREAHWDTLSKSQHQKLSQLQRSIYNYSDDLLALSSVLKLKELDNELTEINQVTQRVNDAIVQAQQIDRVIGIAVKVVALGGAVVSQSPLAIVGSLADLTQEVGGQA